MKTLIYATLALTISLPAFAHDSQSLNTGLRPMPEEVRTNIEDLRQYGDRFEKVIAAIEAEWAKPMWADAIDCQEEFQASRKAGT